uniref:Uncharacterized protein n=1 Tax=Avena sativa TaxID=4498 RepID=A0ACD5TCJ4_AVESA
MDAARIDSIVPHLISLLPPPSVPADWPALVMAARDDGQDHIARLPDSLLSNIVSRLPTTEAARTVVLSTRWRHLWAATPLLVDDAHLRAADGHRTLRAVSRCVAAHPGPVRAVRITRLSFHRQEYALQRLVADLAAKNVQDLILFNCPRPLDMLLPDDILGCASLTRLYLGVWRWRFPGTTTSPPAFPNLHELGLFHTLIDDKKVDALLAHCPKLEILSFAMASNCPSRLRVQSRSLRVLMEWRCSFAEVTIDAPCLERLLFDSVGDRRPIKIDHAPRLEVLGFLDLQLHTLEIGGILIKAGRNVTPYAMLPSVKILAVKVRFGNITEAKVLPTLLRCFPRLETLHVKSIRSRSPDDVDDMDFWKSLPSCDCLEYHLKTFVLHGLQGHEGGFIGYIFRNAKVLESHGMVYGVRNNVVVERSNGSSSSDDEGSASSGGSSGSDDVEEEEDPMSGSGGEGNAPSGGSSDRYLFAYPAFPCWSFQNAIDLSVEDPFYVLGPVLARINLVDSGMTR